LQKEVLKEKFALPHIKSISIIGEMEILFSQEIEIVDLVTLRTELGIKDTDEDKELDSDVDTEIDTDVETDNR